MPGGACFSYKEIILLFFFTQFMHQEVLKTKKCKKIQDILLGSRRWMIIDTFFWMSYEVLGFAKGVLFSNSFH